MPQPLSILIIDDDRVDREAIKRCLPGSAIHEVSEAAGALAVMGERDFDCIFLDYRLPDMDGLEFLRRTFDPETGLAPAPVVMLTGQGNESVMLDALRWGAQDYLLKDHISSAALNVAMVKAREIYELRRGSRLADQQLQHMQKMEAIGQLTSGVAHDFNNLLTVVLGNTRLLLKRVRSGETVPPADIERKVLAIEGAARRGADLVRRMMIFSRQRHLSQEVVDINESVRDTFELIRRALGEAIEIDVILAPSLWPVSIDPGQFGNMLINMAVNARDAMPQGGKMVIETDNILVDEAHALRHPDFMPGAYVQIAISDTGTGMKPETIHKIFEPFYTTKPPGEGTGLGLSMAYGFIRQSGGHIHVYSEEGNGTVFRIYLPRHGEEENDAFSDLAAPSGHESVLVAEDDEKVRGFAVSVLERLGYRILQAPNGHVALDLLRKERGNIDLVFTDIVMPGKLDGINLVRQMREFCPEIKVLYTTGYTEKAIPDYQLRAGEEFISKPYRREMLALKVRKVLDGKERR